VGMSLGDDTSREPAHDRGAPPTDTGKMVAAGVLLAIPLIALMWVPSYAKETPKLFGFPFFFWYQFLWVFLCSGFTYAAYVVVRKARPHRPMNPEGDEYLVDPTEDGTR
jgi:Protein of unknown function (DUF3311)